MNNKRTLILRILTAILVIVLSYALIRSLMIYVPLLREKAVYDQLRQDVRSDASSIGNDESSDSGKFVFPYESLAEDNPDFRCWLTIDDTDIDYPVMKSSEDEPEFYKNRDFYGKASHSGSLFIGGGCNEDSDIFIIFGNNTANESMFGSLYKYSDYKYAESHNEIKLSTPAGNRTYRVFSVLQSKVYDDNERSEEIFKYYEAIGDLDKEAYESTVHNLRSMSITALSVAPEYPQQILILSTLDYHTEGGRFAIAAYRTE